ncbi:hypothetical protein imdm_1032 [gamma proteobacterium IMCC2047]|nr:hypothetical protein imdm_1032 [gamma proteobacterium IMCC2047]
MTADTHHLDTIIRRNLTHNRNHLRGADIQTNNHLITRRAGHILFSFILQSSQ